VKQLLLAPRWFALFIPFAHERPCLFHGQAEFDREDARNAERPVVSALPDMLSNGGVWLRCTALARSVAMRYVGQSFEIDIPWSNRFETAFHAAHLERYGYADRARPVEIVSLRLRGAGVTQKPAIKRQRANKARRPDSAHNARVYWSERATRVPVYAREGLRAGDRLAGPAIITEYSSTTLIPPKCKVEVDPWANLVIEVA
jgi:N-methylhydantoinase A